MDATVSNAPALRRFLAAADTGALRGQRPDRPPDACAGCWSFVPTHDECVDQTRAVSSSPGPNPCC